MTSEQLLAELEKRQMLRADILPKLRREILLSGKSAEELINERQLLPDAKVAEVKSELLGVPYQKVDVPALAEEVLQLVPEETVRTYGVAPLARQGDLLVVGMLSPDDSKAQEALKFIAQRNRLNLGVYMLSYSDWLEIVRRYSPFKTSVEAAVKAMRLKPGASVGGRKIISLDEDLGRGGEEAPIIKIVADTFREAVQSRASDIHLEPQENYLRIRFRIDGDLKEAASLPAEIGPSLISRIKVVSNLKIDETRIPQDGRFRSRIFDREIDFRIATFPTPLGEKMAIRILDPSTGLKSFDQLGLSGPNLETVRAGLTKPFGMVLITGPTGSGKTTSLYAMLQELNNEAVNIVSLEDPVEYFVAGINQSQVRPEIGYDFASGLRQILRQDPDVIMVGEIRDAETASLAIQAALTGHVVLATLHTNNAAGVIPRLLDMKVEPFLMPVAVNLMVAQRLVGQLCSDCKVAVDATGELEKAIIASLSILPAELAGKYKKPYRIYRAEGCPKCHHRGVVGRIAIYEVLRMSPALEEVIATGPTLQKIFKVARAQGMVDLRADGVVKALDGTVSMEEVMRTTDDAGYDKMN